MPPISPRPSQRVASVRGQLFGDAICRSRLSRASQANAQPRMTSVTSSSKVNVGAPARWRHFPGRETMSRQQQLFLHGWQPPILPMTTASGWRSCLYQNRKSFPAALVFGRASPVRLFSRWRSGSPFAGEVQSAFDCGGAADFLLQQQHAVEQRL
jgi:hypothetical protein